MKVTSHQCTSECGQALSELVILVPLFILIVGVFLVLATHEARVFEDTSAVQALVRSDAGFSAVERAAWRQKQNHVLAEAAGPAVESDVDNLMNASQLLSRRTLGNAQDGVARDRKRVRQGSVPSGCEQSGPKFSVSQASGLGAREVTLETCASSSGYSFENQSNEPFLKEAKIPFEFRSVESKGAPVFLQSSEFRFERREKSAIAVGNENAAPGLAKWPSFGGSGAANQTFNRQCLMNRRTDNVCRRLGDAEKAGALSAAMQNAGTRSLVLQLGACLVEACLKPPTCANPALTVLTTLAVGSHYSGAVELSPCSSTTGAMKAAHGGAKLLIQARTKVVQAEEAAAIMEKASGVATDVASGQVVEDVERQIRDAFLKFQPW